VNEDNYRGKIFPTYVKSTCEMNN